MVRVVLFVIWYSHKVATLDIHPTPRHHKPIGSMLSCNWMRVILVINLQCVLYAIVLTVFTAHAGNDFIWGVISNTISCILKEYYFVILHVIYFEGEYTNE